MNLARVRAELEDEISWRLEELRFLKNQLTELRTEDERDRFRRALVVMLYSHFEGFWKAAFMIYVNALNECRLHCMEVSEALVAAAFADVFEAMSDSSSKSDFFRNKAPDDTKLHRFCRHAEFARRVHDFISQVVAIEPEKVVDTESNLKPIVIRKNLFRLGFPHDALEKYEGAVNRLLHARNGIAHGSRRLGVSQAEFDPLETAVVDVMKSVLVFIYDSLRERRFLRRPAMEYSI